MAFAPGFQTRILVDTFHLSTVLNKFDIGDEITTLDATVFSSPGAKEYIPGITGSALTAGGFFNAAASSGHLTLLDGWKSAEKPVTVGLNGLALGNAVQVASATESQFKTGAEAGSIVTFDLAAQTNGLLDYGQSLHDLAAETDTFTGVAVDGGAASANGGIGQLHLTALSTITAITLKIQHSVNGSTSWADLVTFTAATGATSERIVVAPGTTVREFTRVVGTATGGPGSCTFHASFCRR